MSLVRFLVVGLVGVGGLTPLKTHAGGADHPARLGRRVSAPKHRLFPDRVILLAAAPDAPGRAGLPRLLCFAGDGIEALAPQTGRPTWPAAAICRHQPTLLGEVEGTLLFSTAFHLFALHAETGRPAWSWGEPPPSDPLRDPESVDGLVSWAVTPEAVYVLRGDGALARVDARTGRVVWQRTVRVTPETRLAVAGEHVVLAAWRDGHGALRMLASATGAATRDASVEDASPIRALRVTPDGNVLAVSSRRIHALDPRTGARRWQIATDDRFVFATLAVAADRLIVSPDGRRLQCHALADGGTAWSMPATDVENDRWMWARHDGDVVYAGGTERICALDIADGRVLWSRSMSPAEGVPPIVIDGGVLIVEPAPARGERLRIRRLERMTGRPVDFGGANAIVTAPLSRFGGVHAADGCIAILDGRRLIRYVVE